MSITQPKVLPETLSYRLRSVLVRAEGPANYFLPLDQLNNILDQPSVKDEIITLFPEQPPEQRDELVDRICGPEGKPQLGLCRKVFAVLLMSSQGRSISQFIAQNISDADIPLEPISEPNNITGLQRKVKSDSMPIKLDGWDHNNYMNFLLYQRQVNVPFFTNDASRKDEIPILEEQTILPWVKDTTPTDGPIHSGHSEVRAICIHKGHHNFPNTYSQSVFALKKLHMRDPKDIDPEIKTLRRFSLEDQAHLIQLLTAFYWNNECHLLFPWAHGGSLEDLWRKHDNPPLTKELMVWVSKQCHGIATGLHQIHERQLSDRSLAVRTDRESSRVRGNMEFGLHGDIKPANILWFKKPQERLGAGDLKICDFGLVKFHERETAMRSGHGEWMTCSLTYRSPEWNLDHKSPDGRIKANSRRTDIWALGCVYLEFVTWILLGSKGIDKFSDDRTEDDQPASRGPLFIQEDIFFQINTKGPGEERHAVVKDSVVKWIDKLRHHPSCTQYLHDFLDLIQTHMLEPIIDKRSKCNYIKEELGRLSARCRDSNDYCCRSCGHDFTTSVPDTTHEGTPLVSNVEPEDKPGIKIFDWLKIWCCCRNDVSEVER